MDIVRGYAHRMDATSLRIKRKTIEKLMIEKGAIALSSNKTRPGSPQVLPGLLLSYASEENYTYLENNHQNAYIKPSDHEVKKTRRFLNNVFHKDNMPYDEETDAFVCPNGKKLLHTYDRAVKTDNGYTVKKSYYVCESCAGCPFREKCYKGQYENRKIELSKTMHRQKEEAEKRISSAKGILLRVNRSIQVEDVFGVLKQDYGFRRFLSRGKKNNETRLFILAMAFNIQKLCSRIANGRFGNALFELKAA